MSEDKNLIRILFGCFVLSYLFTFPSFFFSVDELSYFSRAVAFAQGDIDLVQTTISGNTFSWAPADYPIGTASLLSFFCFFSKNLIFLSGLIYTTVAGYLIYRVLKKEQTLNYFPFLLFFIFPPTVYFSRGLMSEMPSLLLLSLFTFFLFNRKEDQPKYLLLGFLAGLSILFRETNIVLCGGLVVLSLLQKPKHILHFVIGTVAGILPRIFSASFLYENVGYVKQYAPFGIEYFISNLPLYLIILSLLLPGGLYVLYKYQGKLANSIKLALGAFTLLHLVYGYNSGDHSGFFVSLFYNGRYYLPTLPLWLIAYASFARSKPFLNRKNIKISLTILGVLFIVGAQIFYARLEKGHREVASAIFKKYNTETIIYDNSAYRYLNPLHGKINQLEVLKDIKNGQGVLSTKAFLVLSHRNNSGQQLKIWDNQLKGLQHLKDKWSIREVENYAIFDGTNVLVFELLPR